jgi:hypothetical protein
MAHTWILMQMALLVGAAQPQTGALGPFDDYGACMKKMAEQAAIVPPANFGDKALTVGQFCIRDDAQGAKPDDNEDDAPDFGTKKAPQ